MTLQFRPFDQMTEADLIALRDNGVREGRTLDYKLSLPNDTDGEKKELLADITALANTPIRALGRFTGEFDDAANLLDTNEHRLARTGRIGEPLEER